MTDEKAPFNMAIATLMRIDDILKKIYDLEQNMLIDKNIRQAQKVLLVKELFIQSAGLLTETQRSLHQENILNLNPVEVQTIKRFGSSSKLNGMKVIFNEALEKTLNNFIILVQVCLQDEKYLMPPRKDPKKAVSEMG